MNGGAQQQVGIGLGVVDDGDVDGELIIARVGVLLQVRHDLQIVDPELRLGDDCHVFADADTADDVLHAEGEEQAVRATLSGERILRQGLDGPDFDADFVGTGLDHVVDVEIVRQQGHQVALGSGGAHGLAVDEYLAESGERTDVEEHVFIGDVLRQIHGLHIDAVAQTLFPFFGVAGGAAQRIPPSRHDDVKALVAAVRVEIPHSIEVEPHCNTFHFFASSWSRTFVGSTRLVPGTHR